MTRCAVILGQILEAYKRAKNRLIISDYDGTLTTLQSLPQLAGPPAVVTNFLDSLCRDDKNRLFIISGRYVVIIIIIIIAINIIRGNMVL